MAYSDNIRQLAVGICQQGYSSEQAVEMLSRSLDMRALESRAALSRLAASVSAGWTEADYLGLLDSIPTARTVRSWLSEVGAWSTPEPVGASPQLRLGLPRVDILSDGISVARYVIIDVANAVSIEAEDCSAWAEVLDSGLTVPLHFEGTEITAGETDAPRITIGQLKPTRLDVAFAMPQPGQASTVGISDLKFRNDVVMYVGGPWVPRWGGEGCWLAEPSALCDAHAGWESFLPPGEYRVQVTVSCPAGSKVAGTYILTSPASWEGLEIRQL